MPACRFHHVVPCACGLFVAVAFSPASASGQAEAAGTHADAESSSDAVDLPEYVVSAAGFSQEIAQAPASISLIGGEELQERRVNSLAEALAEVEGVDVGATAGKTGGLNISMRGMPSDYTLVLVDGRRQNSAGNVTPNGFGETSTSFLPPPAAIERIEVVRGPMSTLYGSDAMGGLVNIITRKVGSHWGGSVTLGGTLQEDRDFGDSLNTALHLSGPLVADRLALTLRGSWFHREASDLAFTDAEGDPIEVSKRGPSPVQADIHALGGRLLYTHGAHDLWLDGDVYRQVYDNSAGQLGTLDRPEANSINGYGPELRFHRDQLTLAHTWRLARAHLDTSLTRNATETLGRTIPRGTPGKEPGSPRDLENENLIAESKAVVRLEAHTLTLGGQYWEAEMVDGVAPQPYEQTQWALFAEDEWMLARDLRLTLGLRHDEHSQFGGQISPRAYLVWNGTRQWSARAGVSQGFKAPRLDQLADGITGFTGQGTRPTIGTPSLTPETSTTTEIGVAFDNHAGLRAGLTVFNNEFADKIADGPGLLNATFAGSPNRPGSVDYGYWPAVDTFAQLVNVDEAVTRGVEASTYVRFDERWSLNANYTYTHSEQKSGAERGEPLYNTPEHMINARVRWVASSRSALWLSGEFRDERYRNPDSSTSTAKATWGDYRSYTLFHLGGSWQATPYLTLNATIYNLLDRDFVDYRPYVSNINTGAIGYTNRYANSQEPRRLWLSATYLF